MACNYVGILQEKCQKLQKDFPRYEDIETNNEPNGTKKCQCKLYNWTTEGSGVSKKCARQIAAQLMLIKVEKESWPLTLERNISFPSIIGTINYFADKHKKEKPLLSEKGREDDLFVIEYTFDGYTAVGKGSTKKSAKEKALEKIADHFNILAFCNDESKKEERLQNMKSPVQVLIEFCQARKFALPEFKDQTVQSDKEKSMSFTVSCSVNDLITKSQPTFSKKDAKKEASSLMLDKLMNAPYLNTPDRSPCTLPEMTYTSLPEADLSSEEDESDDTSGKKPRLT